MAEKQVAVASDIEAKASSGTSFGGYSGGSWAVVPASLSVTTYPKLKVGGAEVAYKASASFVFSGGSNSGGPQPSPLPDTENPITLTASTTKLQKGENNVLRDGDSQQSAQGNTVHVKTSRPKLKSG